MCSCLYCVKMYFIISSRLKCIKPKIDLSDERTLLNISFFSERSIDNKIHNESKCVNETI